jgi:aromatase
VAAHTDNAVEIEAPLEFVWERMNDVENWPNLFTEYASVEVLKRDGDTIEFRLTTHPDPENEGRVWKWVSERKVDEATHSTKSHRIETGPFEYMQIEWFFEPTGAGTRMRWVQDFAMKPDAPASDEEAEAYMNRNTLVQMQAIKERLEAAARVA